MLSKAKSGVGEYLKKKMEEGKKKKKRKKEEGMKSKERKRKKGWQYKENECQSSIRETCWMPSN